jgi:hypothetical protein
MIPISRKNHDELGMFNHEGDHGITLTVARSGYFSSPPGCKNINSAVAQM